MSSSSFENLKITFDMQTPICMSYPWIFFDSILAHVAARRADPDSYRKLDSKRVDTSLLEKRIRKLPIHWDGIYHASCSQLNDENISFATIYKRFADAALFNLHPNIVKMSRGWKVRRGQGQFKDYMIKLVTFHVKNISFYVKGNAKMIADMLQDLPALGKKSSVGFGFFNCFKIENTKKDYSVIKDNIAMRPIPISICEFYDDMAVMNFKPPYWSTNVTKCVPPGAKAILK